MYDVKHGELERGFEEWKKVYNNGSITTTGQLAACLTDMRRKLKVFPGSDQTIYTKNAILEGLGMRTVR